MPCPFQLQPRPKPLPHPTGPTDSLVVCLLALYAIRLGFLLDPGLFRVVGVIIFVQRRQREKTGMTAGVVLGARGEERGAERGARCEGDDSETWFR